MKLLSLPSIGGKGVVYCHECGLWMQSHEEARVHFRAYNHVIRVYPEERYEGKFGELE